MADAFQSVTVMLFASMGEDDVYVGAPDSSYSIALAESEGKPSLLVYCGEDLRAVYAPEVWRQAVVHNGEPPKPSESEQDVTDLRRSQ